MPEMPREANEIITGQPHPVTAEFILLVLEVMETASN
jgi:hypothetical protein